MGATDRVIIGPLHAALSSYGDRPVSLIQSFPPLARADAKCLVLGSIPGIRSLTEQQYYAHPQNAFWRIFAELLGFDAAAPYAARCAALTGGGIALWDVLASCRRPGSLDSSVEQDSIAANDIAGFLDAHAAVSAIYFNGALAEKTFRRHVLPTLPAARQAIHRLRLPSTSPAHAGLRLEDKLAAWRCVAETAGTRIAPT